jgi:hypothetical protein
MKRWAGGTWVLPTIVIGQAVGLGFDPEWIQAQLGPEVQGAFTGGTLMPEPRARTRNGIVERALSKMTIIGIPGCVSVSRRNNAQSVSAVMYVRFWTVKTSCVIAFKAASTFTRWRPEGALTNNRSKHQTIPKKGAKTTWAASIKQTAGWPA